MRGDDPTKEHDIDDEQRPAAAGETMRRLPPSPWGRTTGLLRIVLSVSGAILLAVCLGLIILVGMVASDYLQGDDEDESPIQEDVLVVCQFAPIGDVLVVYGERRVDPALELARLPGGQTYPVLRLADDYVMVPVDATVFGWAERSAGELRGDCDTLADVDEGLLPCLFTNVIDILMYDGPQMSELIGALAPGTYPVVAAQGGAYLLQVTDEQRGWVAQPGGVLSGDCTTLPTEP